MGILLRTINSIMLPVLLAAAGVAKHVPIVLHRPVPLQCGYMRNVLVTATANDAFSADEAEQRDLVQLDSMSAGYKKTVESALVTRNKERILSGLPKYESISAMVDA